MIYLLHGTDTYSLRSYLDELRGAVGMPDVQDANITSLNTKDASPASILGLCQAMPFLAERRMVIIDGLVASLAGDGKGNKGKVTAETLASWQNFFPTLPNNMPSTSVLVFIEGQLRANDPVLKTVITVAQVLPSLYELKEFGNMNPNDLRGWVQERVMDRNGSITTNAVQLLVDMIGPDLWTLASEVEKLLLYTSGRAIEIEDVEEMVTFVKEVSVFALVDAVLEGNRMLAMRNLTKLLEGEATVSHLLSMLGRQVRMLLLAKELIREKVPQGKLGSRLGINSAYPLRKTLEQARRFAPQSLRVLHEGLLNTDVAIKTGAQGERLALEFLVAEMCQIVSGHSNARRAAG
ncbi:MAG: DNA polymerase III subunit delta [Chloroflexota bacterium]|nr:DNA polymerase III subunit delta [Chloroflexota bacterium]